MNESRKYYILFVFILVSLIYLVKLFYLQVVDSTYKQAAEYNVMQRITDYPFRGLIYDRDSNLIVHNRPVFDLMMVTREARIDDTTLFCQRVGISREQFDSNLTEMKRRKGYSSVQPSVFMKMLSVEDLAKFEDYLVDYPGLYVQPRILRGYTTGGMANALGYVAEINRQMLDKDSALYYRQGDYIGISGIESTYEPELRGRKGVKFKMVNVRGIDKGNFKDGKFDTLALPGKNLVTTIDYNLQKYGEQLMEGKAGSVVAIEPSTGEILSLISSPSYNPQMLSGREFSKNFQQLTLDSLTPLYNRAIMSVYPPGSTFKPLQALIGMQEGVIRANEQIHCPGGLVGDHAPPGYYDVKKAIQKSSNNYFYIVFRRIINQDVNPNTFIDSNIGLRKWNDYLTKFGLGTTLGIDIPNEKGGKIPTPEYYDRIYGQYRWKWSTINSVSIGQGEILTSPLQMANYTAIIANKGWYIRPHIVKSIGDEGKPRQEYLQKNYVGIDSVHFAPVADAMEMVINEGTGFRARIPGIIVCGKTGTSQNPHGEDHSVFIAYAPKDNPKIAISVYVQNAGQGARAAASIAGLMIEKYLTGEVNRKYMEEFALKGHFIY
ncbi:MAG: penicillin-binding protein 2 [Cyclobacteriaceae bacterium]